MKDLKFPSSGCKLSETAGAGNFPSDESDEEEILRSSSCDLQDAPDLSFHRVGFVLASMGRKKERKSFGLHPEAGKEFSTRFRTAEIGVSIQRCRVQLRAEPYRHFPESEPMPSPKCVNKSSHTFAATRKKTLMDNNSSKFSADTPSAGTAPRTSRSLRPAA